MVSFAGYITPSLQKYVFNDSVSKGLTLSTDAFDFCGEKLLKFKINSTETSILAAKNSDSIVFSPLADTINFGVGSAEIIAYMKNYPYIESLPISFTVTILGSLVPQI